MQQHGMKFQAEERDLPLCEELKEGLSDHGPIWMTVWCKILMIRVNYGQHLLL